MKKTMTRTETRTIEVCDLCERDAGNGFHRCCSICGNKTCLTCGRTVYPEVENGKPNIIDWQVTCCHECEAIGADNLRQIQQALRVANRAVANITRDWRGMVPGICADNKREAVQ